MYISSDPFNIKGFVEMKVDVALLLFALSNFLEIMRNHTRLNTPRKQSIVSRVIRA